MTEVEVRTRTGWRRLRQPSSPARVLETDTIELRGLPAGKAVQLGRSIISADAHGLVTVRPAADPGLRGHIGLLEVAADGSLLGEIELVAAKMSEDAYHELRADLQRVWTNLVFDVDSVGSVSAGIPPARELWRRIDSPVRQIVDRPNEQLAVGTVIRRLDQVRRPRELRPAVVRAGSQGRPALVRNLARSVDTPENHLTAVVLQLLKNHARRDPDAHDITQRLDVLLREPVFFRAHQPLRRITWGMRADSRYRRVLAIHEILNRPELAATEGPGELRLGVRALARLYEYWVFLQILLVAASRYGPPIADGFGGLSIAMPGRRRRLDLPPGTTVTFPGPVHVAFEPMIDTRASGWMGLEYVPHPTGPSQLFATPDVVVLRGGAQPSAIVFDAKYIGRDWVEAEAAKLHGKYGRMRLNGEPVVRNVVAVHPHRGFAAQWAGYGHMAMVPGAPCPPLPLPSIGPATAHARTAVDVAIVADQYWMHQHLGGRRLDVVSLAAVGAGGRPVRSAEIVVPELPALRAFGTAVTRRGWVVRWSSPDRAAQIAALATIVSIRQEEGTVVVITGDDELCSRLPETVETFEDLDRVPSM